MHKSSKNRPSEYFRTWTLILCIVHLMFGPFDKLLFGERLQIVDKPYRMWNYLKMVYLYTKGVTIEN